MKQRVLFIVVDRLQLPPATPVIPPWDHASCGALAPGGAPRDALLQRAFFDALVADRLAVCAVGSEWAPLNPKPRRGLTIRATPMDATSRLSAVTELLLNQPWDLFALWLTCGERTAPAAFQRQLNDLVASQTLDVAVVIVDLGTPTAQWCWRFAETGKQLAQRPIEDVLPTILHVLGIAPATALPGNPVDWQAAAASGYTAEEEQTIQKRLEDLGYI